MLIYQYSPLINGKIEDRICGYGPRVAFYIVKDTDLKARRDRIYEIIHLNYQAAFRYVNRFNYMQVFFQEDCAKTQSEIEEERCKAKHFRNASFQGTRSCAVFFHVFHKPVFRKNRIYFECNFSKFLIEIGKEIDRSFVFLNQFWNAYFWICTWIFLTFSVRKLAEHVLSLQLWN